MKKRNNFIIAIDGPSASGKSTIAKKIASAMEFKYLNTGNLYRLLALEFLQSNKEIKQLLIDPNLTNRINLFLERKINIESDLNTEEIAKVASRISTIKEVRYFLLPIQRNFAYFSAKGAVLDGRDISSVVLPNADFKIFITATTAIRAMRRFKDLTHKKKMYKNILHLILHRDIRDLNRNISPLVHTEDAFYLDSTYLNQDEVFRQIIKKIKTFL